jgi:hypothetical protein
MITNPPNLPAIDYRAGDFASFRQALLRNLPGEQALAGWRPSAQGDLALQLLEWWAYLADVLTFYSERIANQSYLGTAVPPGLLPTAGAAAAPGPAVASGAPGLPDTPTLIAGNMGYQSKPGLAATGQLAVLVNAKTAITLPPLFAVQSKPGPGQQAQVFEADAGGWTCLPSDAGGVVNVDLAYPTTFSGEGAITVSDANFSKPGPLLKGSVTSIKAGDVVVIGSIAGDLGMTNSVATSVTHVAPEVDVRGRTNTRLSLDAFTPPSGFADGGTPVSVSQCQVLRTVRSTPTYAFSATGGGTSPIAEGAGAIAPVISGLILPTDTPIGIHLAGLTRDIAVGDLVVLEMPPAEGAANPSYQATQVTAYQETIWYANADAPATAPQKPPSESTTAHPTESAIPIPHSFIQVEAGAIAEGASVTRVFYGYRPVTDILDEEPSPAITASEIAQFLVQPNDAVDTSAKVGDAVLIEGADGLGAVGWLTAVPVSGQPLQLKSTSSASIKLPMRVLFNVVNVTAGKTVSGEVLGGGDATQTSQSFALAKSPLTYLQGADPTQPVSTLQVFVDGAPWTEVGDFNGQGAEARVFITRRDKHQNTLVTFGDGVHGARPSTGSGNITATYRYGAGPGDPARGGPAPTTLVTVLTPYPGLGSVRNPIAMTGGAAPSAPTEVQQSAPNAVLALGRAVSPADYQALAAQSPLVTGTLVQSAWDPIARRTAVTVFVRGGDQAVAATQAALAPATDPNRAVRVVPAIEVDLWLSAVIVFDPQAAPAASITSAVTSALTDPVTGLFAPANLAVGASLYDSQVLAACMGVTGVTAARSLILKVAPTPPPDDLSSVMALSGPMHSAGPGGYFALAPANVSLSLEPVHG